MYVVPLMIFPINVVSKATGGGLGSFRASPDCAETGPWVGPRNSCWGVKYAAGRTTIVLRGMTTWMPFTVILALEKISVGVSSVNVSMCPTRVKGASGTWTSYHLSRPGERFLPLH